MVPLNDADDDDDDDDDDDGQRYPYFQLHNAFLYLSQQ